MERYEVRVSRVLLLFLILIGAIFFYVGMDYLFLHTFLNWENTPESKVLRALFIFFFVGCGGLIVLNEGYYFIRPPLIMSISREGVSFGTGLRYRPFLIPLAYLESVDFVPSRSVTLHFRKSEEIPSSKATSMGVMYFNYGLSVIRPYIDRPPEEIAMRVRSFIQPAVLSANI